MLVKEPDDKNLSLRAPCPTILQAGEASKAVETYDMACQAADAANDIDMEEVALLYTKRGHSTLTLDQGTSLLLVIIIFSSGYDTHLHGFMQAIFRTLRSNSASFFLRMNLP